MKTFLFLATALVVATTAFGQKNHPDCKNNKCEHGADCFGGPLAKIRWDQPEDYLCECEEIEGQPYKGFYCEIEKFDCGIPGPERYIDDDNWLCDCMNDCGNWKDEEGCDMSKCFNCTDGKQSIKKQWFCDGGKPDCPDKSDEVCQKCCQNGGTCLSDKLNDFGVEECKCAKGFSGEYCEDDVDECAASPCAYNADCTNTIGSYTCACRPGYAGDGYDCTEATDPLGEKKREELITLLKKMLRN